MDSLPGTYMALSPLPCIMKKTNKNRECTLYPGIHLDTLPGEGYTEQFEESLIKGIFIDSGLAIGNTQVQHSTHEAPLSHARTQGRGSCAEGQLPGVEPLSRRSQSLTLDSR